MKTQMKSFIIFNLLFFYTSLFFISCGFESPTPTNPSRDTFTGQCFTNTTTQQSRFYQNLSSNPLPFNYNNKDNVLSDNPGLTSAVAVIVKSNVESELRTTENQVRYTFCSGVLVSNDVVLTAAHCFPSQTRAITKIKVYFIHPKTHDVIPFDGASFQLHPEFNFVRQNNSLKHDLAWIKLSGFDAHKIGYKPIPFFFESHKIHDGDCMRIVGFGHSKKSNESVPFESTLLRTTRDTHVHSSNKILHADNNNTTISEEQPAVKSSDHFLFLERNEVNKLIEGDSGGPIYYVYQGQWALAAITHGHYKFFNDTEKVHKESNMGTLLKPSWSWIKRSFEFLNLDPR